ncbi:MAG: cupredoxin domain-containing protein [Betaproteobacteria bacterium]
MNPTFFRRRRVLLTLAALSVAAGAGVRAFAQPSAAVIRVVARKFSYTPGEIMLKRGVPVDLELVTEDVVMGFNAPDFNVRADVIPGKTARVRLTPDRAGTFTFYCDIFCGSGHESMSGTIIVT